MIDQRVSQGLILIFLIKSFNYYDTTQFVKKYGAKIVPIYIERLKGSKFQIEISKSIEFSNNDSIRTIKNLNYVIENMIKKILTMDLDT